MLQNTIRLRPFLKGDEKDIYKIILDNDHYDNMDPKRKKKYTDFHSPENIKRFIDEEKADILIALVGNEKVGVIIRINDRIFRFHILRKYIRKGVGTMLIKKMIKNCRKDGYSTVYTKTLRESTRDVIAFFKKNEIEIEKVINVEEKPGSAKIYFKL